MANARYKVSRLGRLDVVPFHAALLRQAQDRHAGEFGAVVGDAAAWSTSARDERVQFTRDPNARQRRVGHQTQGLPRVVFDYRQDAEPPSSGQRVADEVPRPTLVVDLRQNHWSTSTQGPLAPAAPPNLQGSLLGAIKNKNVKNEFYLTDAVAVARAAGHAAIAIDGAEEEFLGVNSRAELARAEKLLQRRLRAAAFESGVSMADPDTVWFAADTKLAADVTIGPNVRFGTNVSVASGTEIRAFCDIEGARIGRDVTIGPFARLRPGSDVADKVHIGNFVELKATRMGRGAKANHLAYLGDSDIGAACNIGAGTITVNYDGYGKWRTVIDAEAFVGSNCSLVAPIRIGRGANVTAGSVVTEDVPAGAVAFGRARQQTKKGRAAALRAKLRDHAAAARRTGKK